LQSRPHDRLRGFFQPSALTPPPFSGGVEFDRRTDGFEVELAKKAAQV
jgi:hypothetical protein